jgi:hypothetical protein
LAVIVVTLIPAVFLNRKNFVGYEPIFLLSVNFFFYLFVFFSRFGDLDKVQMVLDGHSGRSRGFAFVYYRNIEDATEVP